MTARPASRTRGGSPLPCATGRLWRIRQGGEIVGEGRIGWEEEGGRPSLSYFSFSINREQSAKQGCLFLVPRPRETIQLTNHRSKNETVIAEQTKKNQEHLLPSRSSAAADSGEGKGRERLQRGADGNGQEFRCSAAHAKRDRGAVSSILAFLCVVYCVWTEVPLIDAHKCGGRASRGG